MRPHRPAQASRVAAQSLWLALALGAACAAVLYCNAGFVIAALNPPEPAVASLATEYIKASAQPEALPELPSCVGPCCSAAVRAHVVREARLLGSWDVAWTEKPAVLVADRVAMVPGRPRRFGRWASPPRC
jgi:hypothetical protein